MIRKLIFFLSIGLLLLVSGCEKKITPCGVSGETVFTTSGQAGTTGYNEAWGGYYVSYHVPHYHGHSL